MAAADGAAMQPLRHSAWGDAQSREMIWRIADDVRQRADFKVCMVEVLRADEILEYVAIVGNDEAAADLVGRATPLSSSMTAATLGATYGQWTFIASEWMTEEALEEIVEYGYLPPTAPGDGPNPWHADDGLAAKLIDGSGRLRGFIWLDEPVSGQRLRPEELIQLSSDLELSLRALATIFERDELEQARRSALLVREVIRTASAADGEAALIEDVCARLRTGFGAEVRLVLRKAGAWEPSDLVPGLSSELTLELLNASDRAWLARDLVVIEPDGVWGDEELVDRCGPALQNHLTQHKLGTLVAVPVFGGVEPLGMLVIAWPLSGRRWLAAQSAGAADLGRDLGISLLAVRASERERELIEELQELDAYRATLIATISHEMKTPLTAIRGHLELLEDDQSLSDRAGTSIRVLRRTSEFLATLAEDLLSLSRAEARKTHDQLKQVELNTVLVRVIEWLSAAAQADSVTIKVSMPQTPIVMWGAEDDVHRVMTNLVSNAVKYSHPDSVVDVQLRQQGDQVEFTVADHGLGISRADQEKLFDEFFRSTNTEALSRPGTGLGLPIVRRIVDRYGGSIAVDSEVGRGSTFQVILPVGGNSQPHGSAPS